MDADQRWRCMDVAHHEGNETFYAAPDGASGLAVFPRRGQYAFEAENAKVSPPGGEVRLSHLLDAFKSHKTFYLVRF
jgi:hypothetical protein